MADEPLNDAFNDPLTKELREHVFGLGLISLRYNLFETSLRFILSNYCPIPVADFFFDQWSNEQRAKAIRFYANLEERNPEIIDLIDHLLTFFSVCSENRNILMHSRQSLTAPSPGGSILLEKRMKSGGKNLFLVDLDTLKQVNADMLVGLTFLIEVDAYKNEMRPLSDLGSLPTKRTSPERPPLPNKLDPHQPVVNLQTDKPQPRS